MIRERMRLGLITRCRNEPYVNEYVNHYVNEGVDKIYLIDDNSREGLYKDVSCCSAVQIVTDIPFSGDSFGLGLSTLYSRIKEDFDWIVLVDMDEYITTKKNISNTLRDELLTTFKDVDCIKIPWVMMAFNGIEQNPDCLLETNIYRWNHDKKHANLSGKRKFRCRYEEIEVKCVFKAASFEKCWDHGPVYGGLKKVKAVDGVYNQTASLLSYSYPSDPFYRKLREKNIAQAFLLCYHYRVTSKQDCVDKVLNSNFEDYKKIDPKDFIASDFPEVIDYTLCLKSKERPKMFAK